MNQIIVHDKTREKRFAILQDQQITEVFIQRPEGESKVGNIYLGKVAQVKTGMDAAFVDLGAGKHGYLHRDQIPAYLHSDEKNKQLFPLTRFLHEGEKILVQVKKDETELKGALLTALIELTGDNLVYLPDGRYSAVSKKGDHETRTRWRKKFASVKEEREGVIVRTEAFSASEADVLAEFTLLRQQYQQLLIKCQGMKAPALLLQKMDFHDALLAAVKKLGSGTIFFDNPASMKKIKERLAANDLMNWEMHEQTLYLEEELMKALKKVVWLNNGAYFLIEETEALIVIDVNTGKFTGKQNQQETVLQTNLAAAKEIGRQIKLRDLSGIILIDFINMRDEHERALVSSCLEKELLKDDRKSKIIGFTSLGILQITRKKTKHSLIETMLTNCSVCSGTGKVESAETIAFRLERELMEWMHRDQEEVLIEMTESVKDVFCGENNRYLRKWEEMLKMNIQLNIIDACRPEYRIVRFGSKEG